MRLVLFTAVMALAVSCGGSRTIVHDLDELEANEILVVLEAKGITADKLVKQDRVTTYDIQVPEVDAQNALRILVANKLPRQRSQGFKEVYPPDGGGLIPTKSEEKAKLLMAIQGEIERKLKHLPGIVHAHVSIVQPDKDIVRDLDVPPPPPTASVALVFNKVDDRGTPSVTPDEVRSLVAAAVEDLKPQNVTVVMKKNAPGNLEDVPFASEAVGAPVTTATHFGIRFADGESGKKALLLGGIFLVVSLVSIAAAIAAIVHALSQRSRVRKAEADATRRAGRSTQTGLQAKE